MPDELTLNPEPWSQEELDALAAEEEDRPVRPVTKVDDVVA